MKKRLSKKEITTIVKPKKRVEILVPAALLAVVFCLGVFTALYKYSLGRAPFRVVCAETRNLDQTLKVVFESKTPVKARVEYGTSQVYLNSTEESEEYQKTHEVYVSNVLPGKKHYIKLIGYTEAGEVYESGFITVE